MLPQDNVLRLLEAIMMRFLMPHSIAQETSLPQHQPMDLQECIMYSQEPVQLYCKGMIMRFPKFNSTLKVIKLSLRVATRPAECGTLILEPNSRFLAATKTRFSPAPLTTRETL